MLELHAEGLSHREVAKKIGCDYGTVYSALYRRGIKPEKQQSKPKKTLAGPQTRSDSRVEQRPSFDYLAYINAFKEEMRLDCCPEMSPPESQEWLRTEEGRANFDYWARVVDFKVIPAPQAEAIA